MKALRARVRANDVGVSFVKGREVNRRHLLDIGNATSVIGAIAPPTSIAREVISS